MKTHAFMSTCPIEQKKQRDDIHLRLKLHCMFLLCRREDSGPLVYKEHLPVSQVTVGDTNRPGSEAKLTVGPLRCQGDSK